MEELCRGKILITLRTVWAKFLKGMELIWLLFDELEDLFKSSPAFKNFKIHVYVYITTVYRYTVSHERCCGTTLRDRRRTRVTQGVS